MIYRTNALPLPLFVVVLFSSWCAGAATTCDSISLSEFESLAKESNPEAAQSRATKLCEEFGGSAEVTRAGAGRVSHVACVSPSGPEGPVLSWHPNGKLASAGQMTSRSGATQLCGEWKRYFDSGDLRDSGEWADGVPAGIWESRDSPNAELKAQAFAPAFHRGREWSVVLGTNILVDSSNTPQSGVITNRKIPLPGLSAGGRWGYRLWSWLFVEAAAGLEMFVSLDSNNTANWTHVSFNPFLMGQVYWMGMAQRLRIGLQGGALVPLDTGPNSGFHIFPVMFIAGQYELPPVFIGQKWFVEVATSPPPVFGNPYMARALVGLRW